MFYFSSVDLMFYFLGIKGRNEFKVFVIFSAEPIITMIFPNQS